MNNEKGTNKYINTFLRFISDEDKTNMEYFYLDSLNRKYQKVDSTTDISSLLINDELSYEESDFLLNYSGFNYKHINAVLRDTWNYEDNGDISKASDYRMLANGLQQIIMEHPTTLNDNITVFRGVDLSYFKQYGIESLEDLKSLEGKHMLDRGFVSTSVQEERSFFKKGNDLGLNYNVKIEYMVPHEFKDGIYLNRSTSYTPMQEEFLINSSNLSKVSSVTINSDDTAVIKATLIPKELYDDYYKNRSNEPEQK